MSPQLLSPNVTVICFKERVLSQYVFWPQIWVVSAGDLQNLDCHVRDVVQNFKCN